VDNLDRLVVEQIPRLRRYARALLGDPTRAEDLVQDCLERAWSRIHRWRRDSDMRAWLFTIMHNLYVNQLRQSNTEPKLVSAEEKELTAAIEPSHDASLEVRDLSIGLAQLPAEQREVLLLVALEDMSYEQVAKVLEIPIGTVMSRLHRARERLRIWMSGASGTNIRVVK
jgi:RNA polymerase sigma-70 factor (ECF subfamily)